MHYVFIDGRGVFHRVRKICLLGSLLLMFDKKLDKNNSLAFIVSLLVSLLVDQVRSLCVLEGPYALLKDIHS